MRVEKTTDLAVAKTKVLTYGRIFPWSLGSRQLALAVVYFVSFQFSHPSKMV